MPLHTYHPQDRLRALANNTTLPDRISSSALFADISGFTALRSGTGLILEDTVTRALEEIKL